MAIEVGEYGRTNEGKIFIFAFLTDMQGKRYENKILLGDGKKFENYPYYLDPDEKIIKHSKNIIDVLEVGDYVNGSRIMGADSLTGYMKEIYLEEAPDEEVWCEEIKSVLTHEQYEANCYRLEE